MNCAFLVIQIAVSYDMILGLRAPSHPRMSLCHQGCTTESIAEIAMTSAKLGQDIVWFQPRLTKPLPDTREETNFIDPYHPRWS